MSLSLPNVGCFLSRTIAVMEVINSRSNDYDYDYDDYDVIWVEA